MQVAPDCVQSFESMPDARLDARPLALKENFSWTLLGNVVYAFCQWGVLVVLAKLGSPEMVGQFALALALTAPVFLFANMQLSGVLATDSTMTHEFRDYLALRVISTAVGLLAIT